MRSSRIIHTVSVHAAGEFGDVMPGGIAPPTGDTHRDQRLWIAQDDSLRQFLLMGTPQVEAKRHIRA